MHYIAGRPLGVWLLVGIVVAEGLGMIGAALQLFVSWPGEWLAIIASAAMGSVLLFKGYRLWCFHRAAWTVVLGSSAFGCITAALEIVRGHADPSIWLAAAWTAVTVVYLMRPGVRALFVRHS
jgi:hypothetical protein